MPPTQLKLKFNKPIPPSGVKPKRRQRQSLCTVCSKEFTPKAGPGYRRYLCSSKCINQHKRDLKVLGEAMFVQPCKSIKALRAFAESQSVPAPTPTGKRKKSAAAKVRVGAPASKRKKLKSKAPTDGQ